MAFKLLWSLLIRSSVVGAILLAATGAIAADMPVPAEPVTDAELLTSNGSSESEQPTTPAAIPAVTPSVQVLSPVPSETAIADDVSTEVNEFEPDFAEQEPVEQNLVEQNLEPVGDRFGNDSMAQITSVSQLSDVQPTDWAFQALQSLVERYGVIAGYPDGTFRGNRALTRYEFAAGLNAALDRINELVQAGVEDLPTQADLDVLIRLQDEFAAELATLRGRVDNLEARSAELEANQFSTTTKLVGEAIFSVSDYFGDSDNNQTVFQHRVRLDLVTSFTGEDALYTRIATGNARQFSQQPTLPVDLSPGTPDLTATAEGSLTPRIGGATDNDFVLDWLAYYFPISSNVNAYVSATGGIHSDYVFSTVNPFFEDFDGGSGSISTFSQESPIYRIGGGAGAALNFAFDEDDTFVLSLGYLAETANAPSPGSGLFNGDYAALGQLTFTPSDRFQLGLTYVHGYHSSDNPIFDLGVGDEIFVGTSPANLVHIDRNVPAITNSYGIEASLQLSPRLVINAFGGYTDLTLIGTEGGEIWYYGLGIALPDLFQPGNLGGIFVGVEPYLGGLDGGLTYRSAGFETDTTLQNDTSLHVEAFYKLQLSDNISVTPGLVWITAPDQNSGLDDYVIGTIRTTFTF
ncbi:iron uptake porin [Oculatella sp. FACHB-28]|uniref:iron uptake porin n=1 Tax=Oculatella sp. FACHB-28 TaxID=2692845 RepID=UPI0018EFE672|nr:iron uptake porin [Oculatella sp. FACHB-28]